MTTQRTATMATLGGWMVFAIAGVPALAAADEPAETHAAQQSLQRYAQYTPHASPGAHGPYEVAQASEPQRDLAGGTEPESAPVSAAPSRPAQDVILYKPPSRGAPRARVGGGTRAPRPSPSVQTLAPPHVALTMHDAPTLYWHIDSVPAETVQVVFTLLDEESIDPVATLELPRPESPGIQEVRLAEHGISLEPGIEYEWSIALVVDPAKRSHDVVSSAWLRRVDASDGAAPRTVRELAERSLWYDALAALSQEIASEPTNPDLLAMRSSLLDQADLEVTLR